MDEIKAAADGEKDEDEPDEVDSPELIQCAVPTVEHSCKVAASHIVGQTFEGGYLYGDPEIHDVD